MKLNNVFFIFFSLFFSLSLQAQVNVKGYVKTDDNKPIEFTNIILTSNTSDIINGTISNNNGSFQLKVTENTYKLTVSSIGYETYTSEIVINKDMDLGDIKLKADAQQLNEAVVTAKLIERKPDRFVMNVQGNSMVAGKNMVEMLSLAPSIWVDKQRGISINGKSDIKIMINDRIINMSNDELMTYLESLKAEDIQSIEIITDPGVEYEANASGGILHIKLKKGREGGLNGSVSMGMRFIRDLMGYSPKLNLNYKQNKLSLYGSLSFNGGRWESDNNSTTFFIDQQKKLASTSYEFETYQYWHGNFGAVYELTDKHEVGFTFEGWNNPFDMDITNTNELSDANNLLKKSLTINNNSFDISRYDASVNYKFKMDTLGSYLKAFINYTNNNMDKNRRWNLYENDNTVPDSIYKILLNSDYDIYALRIDYLKKFNSNTSISFGGRYGYAKMLYKSKHENWQNNTWEEDTRYTDDYPYKENISALYAKFDSKWGNLNYTLGLRYENTSLNISEKYKPSYNDLFPSIFLKYTLNDKKGHSVNANYNRKLTRPYYTALNPFREYQDEYSYRTGNPDLKPTYVDTYAAGATLFDKYILTFQYTVYNDVVNYITKGAPESNITVTQPENIDKMEMFYISAYIPVKVTSWYNFTVNASTTKRSYKSSELSNQKWIYSANTQHNLTLPKGWSVGLSAWFSSKSIYANRQFSAMGGIDGNISKKFFDNKFVATANFWNIQGFRRVDVTYKASNYLKEEHVLNQFQVFNFTLTYNFSAGKKVKVNKVERNSDEENRL